MKSRRLLILANSILIIVMLLTTINAEPPLAPNNLTGLKVGDYAKGRYFFYLNDTTIAIINISVDAIWTETSTGLKVIEITVHRDYCSGVEYPSETTILTTALVLQQNRTVIMHAARMYIENSSYAVEISVLHNHKLHYTDEDLIIKIHGQTFSVADIQENSTYYEELLYWYNYYWQYNRKALGTFQLTRWAIAPKINYGSTVNYGYFNGTCVFSNDRMFGNYYYTTVSIYVPGFNKQINGYNICLTNTYFIYEYNSGLIISWDEMYNATHPFKRFVTQSFGREGIPTEQASYSAIGLISVLIVAIRLLKLNKRVELKKEVKITNRP